MKVNSICIELKVRARQLLESPSCSRSFHERRDVCDELMRSPVAVLRGACGIPLKLVI